jgi:hypothetical protein
LWIADSGVTFHSTNLLTGMVDLELCKVTIVGNGKASVSSQKGKKPLEVKQPNYKNKRVILQEVNYVPDFMCNSFTLTYAMTNSAEISSNSLELTITKGAVKIILMKSSREQMVACLQSRHFQFQVMSFKTKYWVQLWPP